MSGFAFDRLRLPLSKKVKAERAQSVALMGIERGKATLDFSGMRKYLW
jgi:hypothetical protein